MPPLALVGNLSRDRVDGGPPQIGGAPYYGALALRAMDRRARIFTKCGAPERRRFCRALAGVGFAPTVLPSAQTAAFTIRNDGSTRVMELDALAEPWRPDEVAELPRGGWVHAAPLARSDFPPETLAELARGRRLLLDGQGLVRPARTGRLDLDADFDPEVLRHVAILKLADEEAEVLAPVEGLGVPEVVVTMGGRGAAVHAGAGGEWVPAREVPTDDPTGAGDVFATAYLVARSDGFRPRSAARHAAAVVAAVLSARRR